MAAAPKTALDRSGERLYVPEVARIVRVRDLTALERLFEIELPGRRSLGHRPGQFVQLSIFGFGEAPISVSSPPSQRGSFELCVRKMGGLTSKLHSLGEGDTVGIRGPFGNGFPIECLPKMDVMIIAGGIGLGPLRSLIKRVLHDRDAYGRLVILYGTKTPGDILFADEIEAWKADQRNEIYVTVDEPAAGWAGHVGVVTTLFPEVTIEPSNTVVVSCVGPPVMYRFVHLKLRSLGVPDEQVYFSLERRMKCGVGKCGHCQIDHRYVCVDGPVFSGAQIRKMREAM